MRSAPPTLAYIVAYLAICVGSIVLSTGVIALGVYLGLRFAGIAK